MNKPRVKGFFDEITFTVSYVVSDPETKQAVIIDPVLNYDPASGRTSTNSADAMIAYVNDAGLDIGWILETHVHADHLSSSPYLQEQLGGQTAIGANVTAVQVAFKNVFNIKDLQLDGSQFDHLFGDGDAFDIGNIAARVIATPGHTPACVTYVIGDSAFIGDTLFMPDYGTARADLPGGRATQVYDSIQNSFPLPDVPLLFLCSVVNAPGRDTYVWETTVAEQRKGNILVNESIGRDEYVAARELRDRQLGMPQLILPSIQVNVRAGHLPDPEDNNIRYLKIPLNAL